MIFFLESVSLTDSFIIFFFRIEFREKKINQFPDNHSINVDNNCEKISNVYQLLNHNSFLYVLLRVCRMIESHCESFLFTFSYLILFIFLDD